MTKRGGRWRGCGMTKRPVTRNHVGGGKRLRACASLSTSRSSRVKQAMRKNRLLFSHRAMYSAGIAAMVASSYSITYFGSGLLLPMRLSTAPVQPPHITSPNSGTPVPSFTLIRVPTFNLPDDRLLAITPAKNRTRPNGLTAAAHQPGGRHEPGSYRKGA